MNPSCMSLPVASKRKRAQILNGSKEEYESMLKGAQLPPELVSLILYLFTEVLDGRNASVGDGVTRALRRVPHDFRQFVQDTAAAGVGNVGRERRAESAAPGA
jgi:hypothetical protein